MTAIHRVRDLSVALVACCLCACTSGSADNYKVSSTSLVGYRFSDDKVYLYDSMSEVAYLDVVDTGIVAEYVGPAPDGRRAFYGICEVSREQWERVMGTRPWEELSLENFSAGSERSNYAYPAYGITYTEAQEFVQMVRDMSGLDVRLADYDLLDASSVNLDADFAVREKADWFEPVYIPSSTVVSDDDDADDDDDSDDDEDDDEDDEDTETEDEEDEEETSSSDQDTRIQYGAAIRHLFGNVREWNAQGVLRGGAFGDNRAVILTNDEASFPADERNFQAGVRIMIYLD